ncbi:MAG: prepilin-type N-terminal cleavage/methylation domain-containing protein [Candidatus Omnitrophota bacterium]|nr:MAG: prepilin-type N-terminal cleavage/methylation domain-containing protein [Candidatus Omnitrophota bacterium]
MLSKGFSLTEILIAIVLMSLVMLTVVSVDITSRRYFKGSSEQVEVFDEAKIAMEHIIRNVQRGVGDIDNPGLAIYDGGTRIRVNLDDDGNGIADRTIEYMYQNGPDYNIVFDSDVSAGNPTEDFADGKLLSATFAFGKDAGDNDIPNHLDIEIVARQDPSQEVGPDNPETTLTSSVVLRAMSCN